MRKALLVLLSTLLLLGMAYADDEMWDDDAVISDDTVVVVDDGVAMDVSAAGSHYYGDPQALGMYLGTGDEIIGREVIYVDGLPYTTRSRAASRGDYSYYDEAIYYPGYGSGAYNYENVYGPLWGVPSDAVGMEGYDAFYYYQLYMLGQEGDELTDEQRRQLETYNTAHQAQADTGEEYADESDYEGIDTGNAEDDWMD